MYRWYSLNPGRCPTIFREGNPIGQPNCIRRVQLCSQVVWSWLRMAFTSKPEEEIYSHDSPPKKKPANFHTTLCSYFPSQSQREAAGSWPWRMTADLHMEDVTKSVPKEGHQLTRGFWWKERLVERHRMMLIDLYRFYMILLLPTVLVISCDILWYLLWCTYLLEVFAWWWLWRGDGFQAQTNTFPNSSFQRPTGIPQKRKWK